MQSRAESEHEFRQSSIFETNKLQPMKRAQITPLFLAIIASTHAQAPFLIEWQRELGSLGFNDFAADVVLTSDGGYLLAGHALANGGDVSGHHGGYDIWVVKLDAARNIEWQRCLGGSDGESAKRAAELLDGSYMVIGSTESNDGDVTDNHGSRDAVVFKLDADGNVVWQRCYGGSFDDYFNDMVPNANGGAMMAGWTVSEDGDLTFETNGRTLWMVELNGDGNIVWQDRFGGSGHEDAYALASTLDGGHVIVGRTSSNDVDASGNHGENDIWVLKLDAGHQLQWQKCLGGTDYELGDDIIEVGGGGYVLVGNTNSTDGDVSGAHGGRDVWTVRLDENGEILWQTCSGGSGTESADRVLELPDGTLAILAYTESNNGDVTGNPGWYGDIWLAILDQVDGGLLWQRCIGGSGSEGAEGFALAGDGSLIIAGGSSSGDGDILGAWDSRNCWIAKLSVDCNFALGTLFIDSNANGVLDALEARMPYHPVTTDAQYGFAWTSAQGEYSTSFPDPGTFQILPAPVDYYTPVPASHSVSFADGGETSSDNDFAFQPTGVFNDLRASLTCNSPFRPGFEAVYSIHYENIGTTVLDPTLTLDLDQDLSFVDASLIPSSVQALSVQWDLPTLAPYESGDITVLVHVDAQNIGVAIESEVIIAPLVDDEDPADNVSGCSVITTGSYDPNDITVDRTSINADELGDPPYLEYLVRFQNTGTDTAFVVRLENNFPEELDVPTLEILSTSHAADVEYLASARRLVFRFDNILLPDSGTNEMLSHGYVRYRVKPRADLAVGDSVLVNASIFFDFNSPVLTNTAFTVVELPTLANSRDEKEDLVLYPNPTSGLLFVKVGVRAINGRMIIRDAAGQEVIAQLLSVGDQRFDLSHLAPGLYIISFQTDFGVESHRIVVH